MIQYENFVTQSLSYDNLFKLILELVLKLSLLLLASYEPYRVYRPFLPKLNYLIFFWILKSIYLKL